MTQLPKTCFYEGSVSLNHCLKNCGNFDHRKPFWYHPGGMDMIPCWCLYQLKMRFGQDQRIISVIGIHRQLLIAWGVESPVGDFSTEMVWPFPTINHFFNSSTSAHSQFHLVVCWNELFIKNISFWRWYISHLFFAQFQVIHRGELLADPWLLPNVKPPFPCWTCQHT